MSASLRLAPADVRRLAEFLQAITHATRSTGIELGAYGPVETQISDDAILRITWDGSAEQYVIDDRSGD